MSHGTSMTESITYQYELFKDPTGDLWGEIESPLPSLTVCAALFEEHRDNLAVVLSCPTRYADQSDVEWKFEYLHEDCDWY